MTRCDLAEIQGCSNNAEWRVLWDMVTDDPQLMYLCDECRSEYDAAVIDDIGRIDPREIPAAQRSRTLNRFIPKIDWDNVNDIVEDCWEWNASTIRGYAAFRFDGGIGYGHRYSFKRFYHIEPPEQSDHLELLHECSTKKCANPAHLWQGTRSQNMIHAVENGDIERAITDKGVERDICRAYEDDDVSLDDLAFEYDVSRSTIHKIVTGGSNINA